MKTLATLLLLVGSLSWGAGTATALPGQYIFVKPVTGVTWTITSVGGKFWVAPAVGSSWTMTTNGAPLRVIAQSEPPVSGADYVDYTPFLVNTATSTGAWVDTRGYKSFTAVVTMDSTYGAGASLYIATSCTNTGGSLPAASFNGTQIGNTITASGVYTFDGVGSWTKLYLNNSSATVSASCIYRRN